MNIVFQRPKWTISIGIGHDKGFCEVPDARFIRYSPAGFISTMPIPACSCAQRLADSSPPVKRTRKDEVFMNTNTPNCERLIP